MRDVDKINKRGGKRDRERENWKKKSGVKKVINKKVVREKGADREQERDRKRKREVERKEMSFILGLGRNILMEEGRGRNGRLCGVKE